MLCGLKFCNTHPKASHIPVCTSPVVRLVHKVFRQQTFIQYHTHKYHVLEHNIQPSQITGTSSATSSILYGVGFLQLLTKLHLSIIQHLIQDHELNTPALDLYCVSHKCFKLNIFKDFILDFCWQADIPVM